MRADQCQHDDREPVINSDYQLVGQKCRDCGEEWPVDLEAIAMTARPGPGEDARIAAILDALPDVTVVVNGTPRQDG